MKYSADLGRWERGIVIEFEADYAEAAVSRARSILREKCEAGELDEDAIVVQIHNDDGDVVFDYMNGIFPKFRFP